MNLFPNDIDKQKLKERWAKSRKKPFSEFFLDQTSPDLSALTGGISGSVQAEYAEWRFTKRRL